MGREKKAGKSALHSVTHTHTHQILAARNCGHVLMYHSSKGIKKKSGHSVVLLW